MSKKSKILVVLTRFPYPTDKGDKLRAYYQLKELSKYNTIHLICVSDEKVSRTAISNLKSICKEIEVYPLTRLNAFFSLFKALFTRLPFQTHYFYNEKVKDRVSAIVTEEAIDLVYVQLLRSMLNIPFGLNCKYYLDFMDAFSLGMSKRAKSTSYPFKFIVNSEMKRLRRLEQSIAYRFHGTSIITKQDAMALEGHVPVDIDIIPNGIDESFSKKKEIVKKDIDLVFVGNMGYYPNVVAAKILVEKVLEGLDGSVKLYLVGTNPSKEVLNLSSSRVIVTGRVDEVQPFLNRSKIFVAPMYAGQGMQNKILEAMSMGIPVLTTPLAAEAFKNIEKSGITVCKEPNNFSDEILDLLSNDKKREALGQVSEEYIENYYRWDTATSTLLNRFEELISTNE